MDVLSERGDRLDADPPGLIRPRVMVQRWTDVVFLHWAYEPEVVQRVLPAGVTVDTFDGQAWIGLVPFNMEGLGFPRLAPLPHVGAFPEVNVRTYVRIGDRRAVWFFSLDVDRTLPAVVARAGYHLNYCAGRVSHRRRGDLVTSHVERRWPRASAGPTTDITVRTGEAVDPSEPFAHFLTARWGLISRTRRGRFVHAPIAHPAWPLHTGEVIHLDDHLVTAAGLPAPVGPPHVMWSPGVPVDVGRPRRLPR